MLKWHCCLSNIAKPAWKKTRKTMENTGVHPKQPGFYIASCPLVSRNLGVFQLVPTPDVCQVDFHVIDYFDHTDDSILQPGSPLGGYLE